MCVNVQMSPDGGAGSRTLACRSFQKYQVGAHQETRGQTSPRVPTNGTLAKCLQVKISEDDCGGGRSRWGDMWPRHVTRPKGSWPGWAAWQAESRAAHVQAAEVPPLLSRGTANVTPCAPSSVCFADREGSTS